MYSIAFSLLYPTATTVGVCMHRILDVHINPLYAVMCNQPLGPIMCMYLNVCMKDRSEWESRHLQGNCQFNCLSSVKHSEKGQQ